MDAFDIFKKLTKGAKFKREDNRTGKIKIKHEEPAVIANQPKLHQITQENLETLSTEETNNTLTLLGPIKATENASKGKKRKTADRVFDEKKVKLLHQEEVNRLRNQLHISVVGRHIPEPITSFQELPVRADIIENLKKCGYTEPTTVQKQATTIMLQERQLLACAPTGSGKTAAFLIPIIHSLEGPQRQGFRAVILCPTRELAKQTQRECIRLSEGRGFRIHIISKIGKAMTQYGQKSSQKYDILVTTPQRLCYLLKQEPPAISLANVRWLVVDEADKLFEMGVQSFRQQLTHILKSCSNPSRKIAMFSATYMPVVAKWCCRNMKGLIRITVGQRNAATELVEQELLFVGNESGKLLAFRDIVHKGITPPVLVFVQSKERAQQLFTELIYDGINVDAIHADRTQQQRDNTVRSFREGKIWVLICTELMARGIDFKGINLVINYDFPTSAISYVHRIGRAGRAGRKGKAVTFFTINDNVNLRSIAQVIKQSGCEVPEYMLKMKKRSKREVKKLKISAPHRDDIRTTPAYELEKKAKRLRRMNNSTTRANGKPSQQLKKTKKVYKTVDKTNKTLEVT